MNICLFTPSFLPRVGGMEIVIDRLAGLFADAGHDVTVLAKTPRPDSLVGPSPSPAGPGRYRRIYYPRTHSQTWLLGSTKQALLAAHAEHRFDVVHAHQAYPTGYVAVRLRSRLGVPVVITSHRGDVGEASRYRHRWIARRRMIHALAAADAVTGVSDELKAIIDGLADGRARSHVIPNGVDLDPAMPTEPPPEFAELVGRPFILTLGRLHHYKGLDVLLEAMALLRGAGRACHRLVIAGDGEIRDDLTRQARDRGIADDVRFVGQVIGQAKAWLLGNCQLFVQPSREEGLPLTVLEAMAAGRPIVGSDLPGIRQLVGANHCGLLTPVGSAQSLADAIARLAGDGPMRERLGQAGRLVAGNYAWPAVAERYLQLFKTCRGT